MDSCLVEKQREEGRASHTSFADEKHMYIEVSNRNF